MGVSLQDSHVRPNLHSSTGTGGGGFGSQTASFYQAQSDLRELVTLAVKTDAILRSCDQNGSSTVTKTIYIHRYGDRVPELVPGLFPSLPFGLCLGLDVGLVGPLRSWIGSVLKLSRS